MIAQTKRLGRERLSYRLRQYWPAYLLLLPVVLWYAIFCYAPMGGLVIAFKKYSVLKGVWGSPWVGMKNFNRLFGSQAFYQAIKNTLIFSGLNFVFGFPLPIIFAILLNEMPGVKYKKVVQTVSYLPHFISWSVAGGLVYMLLSPSTGAIAAVVRALGGTPQNYIGISRYFRPIVVVSDIWKSLGWSAIIYIAAITSVDEQLYEAATIDGANRWQRMVHIDIPSIVPTMVILLILDSGSVLSVGFEKIFLMQNASNEAVSEVISTYTYKMGLQSMQYSFSTAVNLMNTVVNFVMLFVVNIIARKTSDYSLW